MGESKSVLFRFSGNFRPCCGFLCDHHCSMISAQHNAVQMFEKLDRFQIFISAVNIRGPLTVFSSIIQIKNGCHRINTQSVDMEMLNPVKCIGDQEILDFALAKIKDFCSPFRMLALFWIRILVNTSTVKFCQSVCISREMCRYPVKDNTDFLFMQIIYHISKIFRRTISGSRCIISGYLIPPGAIKRMLRNPHQLYMRITHFLHIFCK